MESGIEEVLQEVGFSKNEAKVYIALIELGSTTATRIAQVSKLHRTNVYDALESLTAKGAVAYITKGAKYYRVTNPENLMVVIKEKELKLQGIMPQLNLANSMAKRRDKAYILEGMQGIRAVFNDMLTENTDIYAFGIPRDAPERLKNFIDIFHKQRIRARKSMYHLYNENARDRIKYLNSMEFTRASFLPKEYDSASSTVVYGEKVAFFIWSEQPLAILIESDRMAESYKNYFTLLWKIATKEDLKPYEVQKPK